MKSRRKPLALWIVLALLISSGFSSSAAVGQQTSGRAHVIQHEEGHSLVSEMGVETLFKVGGMSDGASNLTMVRAVFPPNHQTTTHLHEIDEELVYVLDEELTVTLGEEQQTAGPGAAAFIPPGTWMALENRTAAPTTVLVIISRGEAEECFRVLVDERSAPESRARALEECRIRFP